MKTSRLTRFTLIALDAETLAGFYESAFCCNRLADEYLDGQTVGRIIGVHDGARRIVLALGSQTIEILQFDMPGRPYPADKSASDLIFQHLAIVVSSMDKAIARLQSIAGWSPISQCGPQRLPKSSGGVTAFKFRDPEGHPLEFLYFPSGQEPEKWRGARGNTFLGIDHSAISVADTEVSRQFYRTLGFQRSTSSLNHGPEQDKLDNIAQTRVQVTALLARDDDPHIELLCYRGSPAEPARVRPSDVAATRLVIEMSAMAENGGREAKSMVDPDGHHLTLVPTTPS